MPNYKEEYIQYIYSTNVVGSNKAPSYVLALDWLSKMLQVEPYHFSDCINIWGVGSVERLQELYLFVLEEAKKKDASGWNIAEIPKSYLQKGYCSAALKSLREFLVVYRYEHKLIDALEASESNEEELAKRLTVDLEHPEFLVEGLESEKGMEVIRSVRVRSNQHVFRKIILKIYNQSCCITGLNIPEINRASHIVPWAEDDTQRLDPRNWGNQGRTTRAN